MLNRIFWSTVAELHWNSENEDDRIRAIIAKLALTLDADPLSPFCNKIVRADNFTTPFRSITLQAITSALHQPEFFMGTSRAGPIPGAFWDKDQMNTLKRAAIVINDWFGQVVQPVTENWRLGKTPGGALGMNDSVVALLSTLRSIFKHLSDRGVRLFDLSLTSLRT